MNGPHSRARPRLGQARWKATKIEGNRHRGTDLPGRRCTPSMGEKSCQNRGQVFDAEAEMQAEGKVDEKQERDRVWAPAQENQIRGSPLTSRGGITTHSPTTRRRYRFEREKRRRRTGKGGALGGEPRATDEPVQLSEK